MNATATAQSDVRGDDPYIGMLLGERYRVDELLGRGGMGAVYRGSHVAIGGRCAIKILSVELSSDPMLRRRFIDEAKAPNQLDHEGVIKIFDVGDTPDGSLFLAMEYLKGEDLSERLEREGPLPWTMAFEYARQIGSALACAHVMGIVHRDMKPANCFMTQRGDGSELIKIVDFGVAKLNNAERSVMTEAGTVLGTPYYMPPEQARGMPVDHRADIYSLGAILYEMICGEPPFNGTTVADILVKVVSHEIQTHKRILALGPHAADVHALLSRAMAKSPEQRYPDMMSFLLALDRVERRIVASQSGANDSLSDWSRHAAPIARKTTPPPTPLPNTVMNLLGAALDEVMSEDEKDTVVQAPIDPERTRSRLAANGPKQATNSVAAKTTADRPNTLAYDQTLADLSAPSPSDFAAGGGSLHLDLSRVTRLPIQKAPPPAKLWPYWVAGFIVAVAAGAGGTIAWRSQASGGEQSADTIDGLNAAKSSAAGQVSRWARQDRNWLASACADGEAKACEELSQRCAKQDDTDAASCTSLARALMVNGVASGQEQAQTLLERACSANDIDGCLERATLTAGTREQALTDRNARRWLKAACDLGDQVTCKQLRSSRSAAVDK